MRVCGAQSAQRPGAQPRRCQPAEQYRYGVPPSHAVSGYQKVEHRLLVDFIAHRRHVVALGNGHGAAVGEGRGERVRGRP